MGYEAAIIGLLISLAFIALTGVYPGGIIVPSYLALFLAEPSRIAGTLIAAFLTLVTYRLAARYLILFGRRRLVFLILFGALWALVWSQLLPSFFPLSLEFRVIGWVIPGLIANHYERQGVVITTAGLITVTVIIYFLGRLLAIM
jgi:poly-gamma-glutamate biosynthesis protein PgsC/CapC